MTIILFIALVEMHIHISNKNNYWL